MSASENKQIVLDAYAALNAGDPAGYLSRLSDDVVATYYGSFKLAGTYRGKQDFVTNFIPGLVERLEGGIKLTVVNAVAEGDHVVIEARGEARAKDGRDYNNSYSIWFRLNGGKIAEMREYMDTDLAKSIFG
jgi:ketosteroid isomerase-like protein